MTHAAFPDITVVVGSGRSGTSYVQDVLARSLSIGLGPEPQFIAKLHARLGRFGDLSEEGNLRRLVDEMLRAPFFGKVEYWLGFETVAEDILSRVVEPSYRAVVYALFQYMADRQGCTRLGYKDPRDTLHMELIGDLLPTARFLHIMRDGRDVAMSLCRWRFGPTNLYTGCRFWSRRTAAGRSHGERLGDRYHEARFEELICAPQSVGPALVDFIVGARDEATRSSFVEQILATRRIDAVYRWKKTLSVRERTICEAAAGATLRACGYETEVEDPRVNPIQRAYFRTSDLIVRGLRRGRRKLTSPRPAGAGA